MEAKTTQLVDQFKSALAGQSVAFGNHDLAERNRVRFLCAGSERYRREFWQSVGQLEKALNGSGAEHVYIKTIHAYPSDDSNIDVVFRTEAGFQRAVEIARQAGRRPTRSYHEPDKIMFRSYRDRQEHKPAWHFHRGVTWNGVPYMGNQDLFEQRRRLEHENISIEVPLVEHELMIYVGHALFENFVIPLGELYDCAVLSREVRNWRLVYQIAAQYGWENALKGHICLLKGLSRAIGLETALPGPEGHTGGQVVLPLNIPMQLQCAAFSGRLRHNFRTRQYRQALRELYAYPLFYLIERSKMIIGHA